MGLPAGEMRPLDVQAAVAQSRRAGVVAGLVAVGQVDNLIRPWVFRRYASIHPFVTIIGAMAGISYFGLLGLLIGPLAISYFFELIRMYRQEYLEGASVAPEPREIPASRPFSITS